MYIYRHHTAGDVIDLDDKTGLWVSLPEDKKRSPTGHMSTSQRIDFSIRGSYTIENEKLCYFYWTGSNELVFRTPDNKRFGLFRKEPAGTLTDLMPGVSAELKPSLDGGGRTVLKMSTFSLRDSNGNAHFQISYDSDRYLQYYLGNFTFVPDEDLRDWDFFAEVKSTLDELKIVAQACDAIQSADLANVVLGAGLTLAETGAACPRPGLWVACRHLEVRYELSSNDVLPDIEGCRDTWVWVREKA